MSYKWVSILGSFELVFDSNSAIRPNQIVEKRRIE
jgi:hypothetical protein